MTISIRFYGELNEALAPAARGSALRIPFKPGLKIGDLIESLGVSPLQVDLILANGETVYFDYVPRENDRLSVYPLFRSIDITPLNMINRGYRQ